jgi:hypothetical protein
MIVGTPSIFAIESGITHAYERLSFRALGYFVLHLGGQRYGVHAPDASLLACSLDEVEDRLARGGAHIAPFASEADGGEIADAFREAVYATDQEEKSFFGILQPEFSDLLYAQHLIWAPDGDEAFNDGSYVLHFDVGEQVRLIGFRCGDGYHHDPKTLRDVWLPASDYYGILQQWRDAFVAEWRAMPKISEEEDQKEPNKALEPTIMAVTDCAPSSTLRASHDRGSV